MPKRCQAVDQPIAGLLTDLKLRGLLDDTLVLWGGEFGRTPTAEGSDGRLCAVPAMDSATNVVNARNGNGGGKVR